MSLDLARVVAIHPASHTVDLVFVQDGRRVAGVKVLSGSASGSSGLSDLHQPTVSNPGDPYATDDTNDRDVIAVVGTFGHLPVVLGFLFPEVAQCCFNDVDRLVYRHASDAYFTIDSAANAEFTHPSGAYLRVGTNPAHEDLTGKDYDGRWKIRRNVGNAPHIHFEIPGQVAVDFSPAGEVEVTCASTVMVTAGGAVTVIAPSVTLDTPTTHCTGVLNVDGLITGLDGMALSGGSGSTAQITGSIWATEDIIADTISLQNHHHEGVTPGGGETGDPIP